MVVFFAVTTVAAALASFTMLVTGTVVDDIWKSKDSPPYYMLR
jgi:hypothetical protein